MPPNPGLAYDREAPRSSQVSGTVPQIVSPDSTVGLPAANSLANNSKARSANKLLSMTAAMQSFVIDCTMLPPAQAMNAIGTVFVDNTANVEPLFVRYPDTGVVQEVPAESAVYLLAITGGLRVELTSAVTVATAITVALLNFVAGPTGVQPITGTVVIGTLGPVTVANPGPATGAQTDHSITAPVASSTTLMPANANRKFYYFQLPQTSDGWVNFTGGAAAPNALGSFYFGYGEKGYSIAFCTTGEINIYVTLGGVVAALQG